MGFERQRGSEQSLGRAARHGGNSVRMVGVAAEMSKSTCGKLRERIAFASQPALARLRLALGAVPVSARNGELTIVAISLSDLQPDLSPRNIIIAFLGTNPDLFKSEHFQSAVRDILRSGAVTTLLF